MQLPANERTDKSNANCVKNLCNHKLHAMRCTADLHLSRCRSDPAVVATTVVVVPQAVCSVLFTDQLHAYFVCDPGRVAGLLVCHCLQTLDDALLCLAFVQPPFIAAVRILHVCNLLNVGYATDRDSILQYDYFLKV
jgi:hypothetical protein